MKNEKIHSLIPLEDFQSLLGVDVREDKISRFCLITATFTIEQYCKRHLLAKKVFEYIPFYGDLLFPLREYPVREVLAVYSFPPKREFTNTKTILGELIEPDLFCVNPDYGIDLDIPFSLRISPALLHGRGISAIKTIYWAGYSYKEIPSDLASACLELAGWNLSRYRARRVGVTGNIRGAGMDKEHFEPSMPENVRLLLEPYKRRTI